MITVALGNRSYPVVIEDHAIDRAGDWIADGARAARVLIVTDETVQRHVLPRLQAALEKAALGSSIFRVADGEDSKSWATLEALCDWLIENGIERGDAILALGGGVVGDLAGFAAAIVKRGCDFIQIPTTLLAQVDSSVGGKTAINSAHGKNLIGAFHQPRLVLIDPTTLDSLAPRQLRAGYAEIVKYGLIGDAAFFEWCEANGPALLAGDSAARRDAITFSINAKAAIVAEDERETADRRALLNFGHTFGHALEAETGFSDALLHGEAVALGMVLAMRFSAERGLCPVDAAERIAQHFHGIGMATTLGAVGLVGKGGALAAHMAHDKKKSSGRVPFILSRGIGSVYVDRTVPLDAVATFLDQTA